MVCRIDEEVKRFCKKQKASCQAFPTIEQVTKCFFGDLINHTFLLATLIKSRNKNYVWVKLSRLSRAVGHLLPEGFATRELCKAMAGCVDCEWLA